MKIEDLIDGLKEQSSPLRGIIVSAEKPKGELVTIILSNRRKQIHIKTETLIFVLPFDKEIQIDSTEGSFGFMNRNKWYSLVVLIPLYQTEKK